MPVATETMDDIKKNEAKSMSAEVTIALMGRDMEYLRKAVEELKVTMAAGFKDIKGSFTPKGEVDDLSKRVEKLEGWNTWLARLVLGAIILGIISLAFVVK